MGLGNGSKIKLDILLSTQSISPTRDLQFSAYTLYQIISNFRHHFGLARHLSEGKVSSRDSSRHGFFASKVVKNYKLEEVEPWLILLHNIQALIF